VSESKQAGESASSVEPSHASGLTNLNIDGLVLGSHDATPLEFWVGVHDGNQIELDDLVVVETVSPQGQYASSASLTLFVNATKALNTIPMPSGPPPVRCRWTYPTPLTFR